MIFNFEQKMFKKDALIQSIGVFLNSIMIMVRGIAEMYTTFGDNEFKIEYFGQGDIINYTLFLIRLT
jgi:hypothetical protein